MFIFRLLDMGTYDNQYRSQRQNSTEGNLNYIHAPPPPQPTSAAPQASSSSSSHLHQQNYNFSRSIALPDPQHQSRRSTSYGTSIGQKNHDNDPQLDGMKLFRFFLVFNILLY